tara:strand:- start:1821 stop:1976 length:156 start_codon:yes stop_codon:yes gene_type:complete
MGKEYIWFDKEVFDMAIDNIESQIEKLNKSLKVLKEQNAYSNELGEEPYEK